jgi:hypothetical protein
LDFTHAPLPQYAQLAAALGLTSFAFSLLIPEQVAHYSGIYSPIIPI